MKSNRIESNELRHYSCSINTVKRNGFFGGKKLDGLIMGTIVRRAVFIDNIYWLQHSTIQTTSTIGFRFPLWFRKLVFLQIVSQSAAFTRHRAVVPALTNDAVEIDLQRCCDADPLSFRLPTTVSVWILSFVVVPFWLPCLATTAMTINTTKYE